MLLSLGPMMCAASAGLWSKPLDLTLRGTNSVVQELFDMNAL